MRLNTAAATRELLQRDSFWFKLRAPQLAVAGTLLSFYGLALPSFLGGAFFWSNLRDLFYNDFRAGVLRV